MPEPTLIREARQASLANVYKILDEVKANGQRVLEARAKEVSAFDEVGADFFNNYNPNTAEVATTPVEIERVESDEVLENRVKRENTISRITGAIATFVTGVATVTALVGGLYHFAQASNEAVQAVYDSFKPKVSIVETVLQEYGKTLETHEVKPVYAPKSKEAPKAPVAPKVEMKEQIYTAILDVTNPTLQYQIEEGYVRNQGRTLNLSLGAGLSSDGQTVRVRYDTNNDGTADHVKYASAKPTLTITVPGNLTDVGVGLKEATHFTYYSSVKF